MTYTVTEHALKILENVNLKVLEKIFQNTGLNWLSSTVSVSKNSNVYIEIRMSMGEYHRIFTLSVHQIHLTNTGLLDDIVKNEYTKLFRDCLK